MSYPDMKDYITFFSKRYKDFEKFISSNESKPKGRPKVHPDCLLVIFFAIMILKGIHQFKAQHAFLIEHPDWVKNLSSKVFRIAQPYPVATNNSQPESSSSSNISEI